ncbi:hypothetical protein BELL_1700g00010 [Botrytis elliptica]|uniref:Heterokaryon incompatibility domain-containing protein n=1 Tax=Botrytis elliptica TaxID=278938 RepID=A0A4Z1HS66_9HELO|nr:hypothetical protein BELL_1700g00010 [Botrytis elliptica]
MDAANPPLASGPRYRPMNREKNEFRLLKILPPSNSLHGDSDPLAFSIDPIRCELQYELLSDVSAKSNLEEASLFSFMKLMMDDSDDPKIIDDIKLFRSLFSFGESIDEKSFHELSKERKEALYEHYKSSQKALENWRPEGINLNKKSFKEWLVTCIWALLDGDEGQCQSLSYYALSYVWNETPQSILGKDYHGMEAWFTRAELEATFETTSEKANMTPERIDADFGSFGNDVNEYRQIVVDGVPVLIGKNLEKALRTLREIPDIANGTRIWVDALCINQQDIEERNFEVRRMSEIYQKASRVISYLGDESDESGHILEFMDSIGEVMERPQAMASLAADFLKNMQVEMAFFMAKLLQRTYFSRIWIFQEIVLGGVESIVICGARRFSWENLLRCGRVLIEGINAGYPYNMSLRLHAMKSMNEGDEYLTFGDLHVGLTKLQMLRTAIFESQLDDIVGQPVLGYDPFWLRIPSSYEASDSRDLIYGMMSLLPSWLTDLINVNYSTNNHFVDVMRSFAEAYIKSTQSL